MSTRMVIDLTAATLFWEHHHNSGHEGHRATDCPNLVIHFEQLRNDCIERIRRPGVM